MATSNREHDDEPAFVNPTHRTIDAVHKELSDGRLVIYHPDEAYDTHITAGPELRCSLTRWR